MDVRSAIDLVSPVSLRLVAALFALAVVGLVLVRWVAGAPIAPARRSGLLLLRALVVLTLLAILLNPVRVDESPGSIERPELIYLLDSSQSITVPSKLPVANSSPSGVNASEVTMCVWPWRVTVTRIVAESHSLISPGRPEL